MPDRSPPAPHSVSPKLSLLDIDYPYLVAGDFNIHHSTADHARLLSPKEQREFAIYFDRDADLGFTLRNTPRVYTRFPYTGGHRSSAIEMAFANPPLFPAFGSWNTSTLPSAGPIMLPY